MDEFEAPRQADYDNDGKPEQTDRAINRYRIGCRAPADFEQTFLLIPPIA
jgi:hypothetical protein